MKKLVAVFALVAFMAVGVALARPPLTFTTEYDFVGGLGIFDADGRLLAWEGPIIGEDFEGEDFEGVARWWAVIPSMWKTGQVSHWLFRWEIWDEEVDTLLLAGDEKERTIFRHGKNSVWRANGIVTEASGEYEDWIGSQMHDGGNFTWVIPDVLPDEGSGTLRIAGSHSKAAPGRHSTSATSWGNIKSGR